MQNYHTQTDANEYNYSDLYSGEESPSVKSWEQQEPDASSLHASPEIPDEWYITQDYTNVNIANEDDVFAPVDQVIVVKAS